MYSKGDIIKSACKDLPIGTIFKYRLKADNTKDANRTDKLYLIHDCDESHSAICINNGNKRFSITNSDYIIEMEIIRYGQ